VSPLFELIRSSVMAGGASKRMMPVTTGSSTAAASAISANLRSLSFRFLPALHHYSLGRT